MLIISNKYIIDSIKLPYKYLTMTTRRENQVSAVQIQLEDAIQMLRLVAANKRTCLEVEEWLSINYPESTGTDNSIVSILLNNSKKGKE